ncbi:hypothetical protein DC20_11145 [Rufibacter tibetensis]|uniref:Uncharacterized protein n=1 Tax=Rufibacter tibetensis TaxID=512763 RepID=A0A0P0CJ51_9BACT|nr:hypothetical protein DC20_11145 [Rufibacter tibetensis]
MNSLYFIYHEKLAYFATGPRAFYLIFRKQVEKTKPLFRRKLPTRSSSATILENHLYTFT